MSFDAKDRSSPFRLWFGLAAASCAMAGAVQGHAELEEPVNPRSDAVCPPPARDSTARPGPQGSPTDHETIARVDYLGRWFDPAAMLFHVANAFFL